MKTKTWLPIFPGFYNTNYEPREDYEMEYIKEQREERKLSPLPFEAIKFDYDAYRNEVAEKCCSFFESEMKEFLHSITFEYVNSPKEYNFSNDSINIEVELIGDNIKNIKSFLFDHKPEFDNYISDNYTSCSGFISFYENKATSWLIDIDSCLQDKHKLGAILQFIAFNSCEDIEQRMLESTSDVMLQASNIVDCEVFEYCQNCKEFFDPDKGGHDNICPDCFEQSVINCEMFVCACCKAEITNKWEKRELTYKVKHGFIKVDQILCDKHVKELV